MQVFDAKKKFSKIFLTTHCCYLKHRLYHSTCFCIKLDRSLLHQQECSGKPVIKRPRHYIAMCWKLWDPAFVDFQYRVIPPDKDHIFTVPFCWWQWVFGDWGRQDHQKGNKAGTLHGIWLARWCDVSYEHCLDQGSCSMWNKQRHLQYDSNSGSRWRYTLLEEQNDYQIWFEVRYFTTYSYSIHIFISNTKSNNDEFTGNT